MGDCKGKGKDCTQCANGMKVSVARFEKDGRIVCSKCKSKETLWTPCGFPLGKGCPCTEGERTRCQKWVTTYSNKNFIIQPYTEGRRRLMNQPMPHVLEILMEE